MSIVFRRSSFSWLARPGANPSHAIWLLADWEIDEHVRITKRAQMRGLLATSASRAMRRSWRESLELALRFVP